MNYVKRCEVCGRVFKKATGVFQHMNKHRRLGEVAAMLPTPQNEKVAEGVTVTPSELLNVLMEALVQRKGILQQEIDAASTAQTEMVVIDNQIAAIRSVQTLFASAEKVENA